MAAASRANDYLFKPEGLFKQSPSGGTPHEDGSHLPAGVASPKRVVLCGPASRTLKVKQCNSKETLSTFWAGPISCEFESLLSGLVALLHPKMSQPPAPLFPVPVSGAPSRVK